jgi:hypothetical protein
VIPTGELKSGTLLRLRYIIGDCLCMVTRSEWIPARGDWKHYCYFLDDGVLGWVYGSDVEEVCSSKET